jgi:hypothetical protein
MRRPRTQHRSKGRCNEPLICRFPGRNPDPRAHLTSGFYWYTAPKDKPIGISLGVFGPKVFVCWDTRGKGAAAQEGYIGQSGFNVLNGQNWTPEVNAAFAAVGAAK